MLPEELTAMQLWRTKAKVKKAKRQELEEVRDFVNEYTEEWVRN